MLRRGLGRNETRSIDQANASEESREKSGPEDKYKPGIFGNSHSRPQSRLSLLAGKAWGTRNKWLWGHMIWLARFLSKEI